MSEVLKQTNTEQVKTQKTLDDLTKKFTGVAHERFARHHGKIFTLDTSKKTDTGQGIRTGISFRERDGNSFIIKTEKLSGSPVSTTTITFKSDGGVVVKIESEKGISSENLTLSKAAPYIQTLEKAIANEQVIKQKAINMTSKKITEKSRELAAIERKEADMMISSSQVV